MANLVSHDGLDLIHGHALDQGIVQHDSLGLSEAGEVGVGMLASLGGVHREKPVGGESGLGKHGFHPGLQLAFFQRLELVEKRGDELGVDDVRDEHEDHQHHGDDCPPVGRTADQQGRCHRHEHEHQDERDDYVLDLVGKPELECHVGEPEALLQDELPVKVERQVKDILGKAGEDGKDHEAENHLPHGHGHAEPGDYQVVDEDVETEDYKGDLQDEGQGVARNPCEELGVLVLGDSGKLCFIEDRRLRIFLENVRKDSAVALAGLVVDGFEHEGKRCGYDAAGKEDDYEDVAEIYCHDFSLCAAVLRPDVQNQLSAGEDYGNQESCKEDCNRDSEPERDPEVHNQIVRHRAVVVKNGCDERGNKKTLNVLRCGCYTEGMKKILLVLAMTLILCATLSAAENTSFSAEELSRFKLQNTFVGFGVGSRHQGDLQTAKKLLALDITGLSLSVTGGLSLWGSIVMNSWYTAMVGNVTKADIYFSAGMIGAGVVTLIVSKIIGLQAPARY